MCMCVCVYVSVGQWHIVWSDTNHSSPTLWCESRCLKLQGIFRKRATNYSALLQNMTDIVCSDTNHSSPTLWCESSTGRRRPIGCLKLHVIFHKRATNYMVLGEKWPVVETTRIRMYTCIISICASGWRKCLRVCVYVSSMYIYACIHWSLRLHVCVLYVFIYVHSWLLKR